MNKQAAIYARVSTDEQAKGYSLQTQIEACQLYAKDHNYSVAEVFSEDYTGATMDRPELNRLRDFVSCNSLDVVIVYDVDRLARKSAYQVLIEEEFKLTGLSIEFVMAHYEDNDEGRLQKQIRGSIAEYEKAKILERGKRGKRGKAKSGFVVAGSRPPYGYKIKSEPHKAWLEIDDNEAPIVRLIYNWYLDGDGGGMPMSSNSIATKLSNMGIQTRGDTSPHVAKKFGTGIWQGATITHILTNETYTGTWHYGKTKMIDDGKQRIAKSKRGLGKQVPRSREEWISVEVPAIINREMFELAQKRKEYNKHVLSGQTHREYLMKGRLTCAKCGYSVRGHTIHDKHSYYCCSGKSMVVKMCDAPNVRCDRVDFHVWDWAEKIIENPENLRIGLESAQSESQKINQSLIDRINIINEQMEDTKKKLEKLVDLYLNDDFTKEVLYERKTRLEQQLAVLQKEGRDLESHIKTVILTDDQMSSIEAFCAKIRKGLDHVDFKIKRQIIELLDIRGKVAFENGEKVIYLKCLIDPQEQLQVSRVRISPSSSIGATAIMLCACLRIAPSR